MHTKVAGNADVKCQRNVYRAGLVAERRPNSGGLVDAPHMFNFTTYIQLLLHFNG